MKNIRLRYAPSPTGRLHIGGARTALFNYLYAKHMDGDFLVRIEDTDTQRNIEDGERSQIENLEWMGIEIDYSPLNEDETGPFRQSERLEIYNKYIDELLNKGLAYECWCTPEELEEEREKANENKIAYKYSRKCLNNPEPKEGISPSVRIKIPEGKVFSWNDGVRGEISINSEDIGDWVIRKSNGLPTYSFANVIDDHLMKITHVMRGEEHISNTPKQIHLYEVFGWEHPNYSHLTIITDMEGKKLSKRNEKLEQFVEGFKNKGVLPNAFLNYLSLLGWSSKTEDEIFSKEELIKMFTPDGLSKSSSKFDVEKLKWTNNQYIQKLSEEELSKFLEPFVLEEKDFFNKETLIEIFKVFQPQLHYGEEIKELIKLFIDGYSINEEDEKWLLDNKKIVKLIFDKLRNQEVWESKEIKEVIMSTGKENEVKGKLLMMPLRLALTGKTSGPDISKVIEIFGKEKVLERMEKYCV